MTKAINGYKAPIDIFEKLGERKTELSDEELEFICGIIREKQPQKIVEVGVSAGGTSCVILNCLEKLNMDSEFYSVDISYEYHFDKTKKCGYQIEDAAKYLKGVGRHKLILGKTIAEALEEIESERKIDMLILDTIHYLPGEMLDFLVCLPYMSDDAIVVLDDLTFSHWGENTWAIATKVLFDTVTADKYFPNDISYPKMAAFQINDDTLKYQDDLFSSLMTPWYYDMNEQRVEAYRKIIYAHYAQEERRLFEEALKINRVTLKKKNDRRKEIEKILHICKADRKTLIYGAGLRGVALRKFLQDRGGMIEGYIISDDRLKEDFSQLDLPVYHLGEIEHCASNYNIIVAAHDDAIRENLKKQCLDYMDTPNWIYPFIKDYAEILV